LKCRGYFVATQVFVLLALGWRTRNPPQTPPSKLPPSCPPGVTERDHSLGFRWPSPRPRRNARVALTEEPWAHYIPWLPVLYVRPCRSKAGANRSRSPLVPCLCPRVGSMRRLVTNAAALSPPLPPSAPPAHARGSVITPHFFTFVRVLSGTAYRNRQSCTIPSGAPPRRLHPAPLPAPFSPPPCPLFNLHRRLSLPVFLSFLCRPRAPEFL